MPTIHGTVVAIDGMGVLLRGASGAGKTSLALQLIDRAQILGKAAGLVADDRVSIDLVAQVEDSRRAGLEHFAQEWVPVLRNKMRQNKEIERGFDSIKTQSALIARAPQSLAGLVEIYGIGIVRVDFLDESLLSLLVDLGENAARLPEAQDLFADLVDCRLPRLKLGPSAPDPVGLVFRALALIKAGAWPPQL